MLTKFDLTSQNSAILAAQSGSTSDYAITYHETFTDANTGASPRPTPYYNIVSSIQTIYYRIRNVNTSAYAVGTFQLIVNSAPFATGPQSYTSCDNYGDPYDGLAMID